MDNKLKISIITPSFNSADYLEHAIKSVLYQDYDNFEHIIVDGGSTDETLDILNSYPHLRWVSEPDKGQSDAMNKGFDMISGDIVSYLNADDYYLPGAFHAVLPHFNKDCHFVLGKVKVVMDDGSVWINDAKTGHFDMLRHWEPEAFCVNPVGYFYTKEVQMKAGKFSLTNKYSMDLEFLLAASKYYEIKKVEDILGVFRYIEGTKTSENQRDDDVWSVKTFPYIDKYLEGMSDEFVAKFIKDREEGYNQRKAQQSQ